jgi:hypothetical protein
VARQHAPGSANTQLTHERKILTATPIGTPVCQWIADGTAMVIEQPLTIPPGSKADSNPLLLVGTSTADYNSCRHEGFVAACSLTC